VTSLPFKCSPAPSEAALLMEELAADKVEFGRSRIQRWFGRAWPDVDDPVS